MSLDASGPGTRRGRNMDWVAQFEGQMLVCAALAKAFYGAPDREWLDAILGDGALLSIPFGGDSQEVRAASECLSAWADALGGRTSDEAFDALNSDYGRLFVGPARLLAAPWESVYMNKDQAVFQRETVSVKNWYARFGLALTSNVNEPADHAGLEFSFLASLAELTIAASEIRDGQEVKRLVDAQRAFVGQHLLKWVPRWADDVTAHARTDFYRGFGWLARGCALEMGSFFAVTADRPQVAGAFRRQPAS